MKKLISFIMALMMVFSAVVVPASANEEITTDTEMSIGGTNSFGEMFADLAEETVEEQNGNNGCNIFSVEIYDHEAAVKYEVTQDAILIVAIYEEDGVKMLGSGNTYISYEEYYYYNEPAYVWIEVDEMPQYFYVRAFLVNEDYAPLSTAYSSPMYTQEMQELLSKTTADFDEEKILNLDDDTETNFAVFSDDVKLVPDSPISNNVTVADDETNTYVIEDIDKNISTLTPGDTFAYKYDGDNILIVKIESITLDGGTATIKGCDTSMEEVFDYVKIESDPGNSKITYDPTGLDEDMTFLGVEDSYDEMSSRTSVDVTATKELKYGIDKSFTENFGENVTLSGQAKGTVNFKLTGTVKLYVTLEQQYLEFGMDYELSAQLSLKGAVEAKIPIGLISIVLVPGVFIDLTPDFVLKFSAEVTAMAKLSGHVGIMISPEGKQNKTTSPILSIEPPSGKATFYIGIALEPEISLISENLATAKVTAQFGAEVTIKQDGMDNYETGSTVYHPCTQCLDITIKGKLEGSIEAKLLNNDNLKLKVNLANITADWGQFAYSFDYEYFSIGACAFKLYKTTVKLTNSLGEAVSGATVEFYSGGEHGIGITDENGVAICYAAAGEDMEARISCDGYETIHEFMEINRKSNSYEFIWDVGDNLPLMAKTISMGTKHSAAITEDGSLYMWGANDRGQIGNGTLEHVNTPTKVLDNVVSVSLGGYHTAAITADGSLYTWGYNSNKQLGYSTYSKNDEGEYVGKYPRKLMDGVVSVSLGELHSAAITRKGDLYAWGNSKYGQCGTGSYGYNISSPTLVMHHVRYVELGVESSAAITLDNTLYTWGDGSLGLLGNDDTDHFYPAPIKIMEDVKTVSMARYSCGAVTNKGELYTWGRNTMYALLGFKDSGTNVYATPQFVTTDVKDVSMGHTVTAVLKTNGELYMCGANAYGQLGIGSQVPKTEGVNVMSNIEYVSVGEVHCAAVDKNGNMYIWGANGSSFQLLGTKTNEQSIANSYWTISSTPINIMDNIMMVEEAAAEPLLQLEPVEFTLSKSSEKSNVFTDLEPNCIYNFYSVRTLDDDYPINCYNLLYITQAVSDENGCLTIEYIPTEQITDSVEFVVKGYSAKVEETDEVVRGDVDGNGTITMLDSFRLKMYIKQIVVPTEEEVACADVNGDGIINMMDSFELKYRIVKGEWRS